MNTDAAELDKIRRIGFFLTRLGPHDSAAQPKLMRALEAAHQFFVQPETQTLDKDPSWNSPEVQALFVLSYSHIVLSSCKPTAKAS